MKRNSQYLTKCGDNLNDLRVAGAFNIEDKMLAKLVIMTYGDILIQADGTQVNIYVS